MTDDADEPEDISVMMESLWGPRTEAPFQELPPLPMERDVPGGAGADSLPEFPETVPDRPLASVEAEALRSELTSAVATVDAKLSERLDALAAETAELAVLRSDIDARPLTQAHLAEARADLQAEIAEQRRVVLDEAARQIGEQVAGVAGELQQQVDNVAAQLAQGMAAVEARAALAEAAARPQPQQETSVDDQSRVTREDFEAFQSELRAAMFNQMAAAQTELQRSVGLLDTAIADARAQLAERLDQMADLVSQEAARAAERASARAAADVAPLQADVRALRDRVEEISATVAELQQRPALS